MTPRNCLFALALLWLVIVIVGCSASPRVTMQPRATSDLRPPPRPVTQPAETEAPVSTPQSQDSKEQLGESEGVEIGTGILIRRTHPPTQVQYSKIDGLAVFEGDIILGSVEEMEQLMQEPAAATVVYAAVVSEDHLLWPARTIPFEIDPSFSQTQTTDINNAINHWQTFTNVRFRARTAADNDYVTFRLVPDECKSWVGRQGGQQFIYLAPSCHTGSIIHEIGHIVGLWHEQSREDRDEFVTIVWDNIEKDERHNFNQHITDGDDVGPYDYGSIMHYGAFDFAINPISPTIITPQGQAIGQLNGLSAGDIYAANTLYPLWTDNVLVPDQKSKAPPALAEYGGLLHMVHLGDEENVIWHSTFNSYTWSPNVKIPDQKSKAAPALAVYGGLLHMVHLGDEENYIYHSTFDGKTWSPNVKIPDQKSKAAPALAVYGGLLHMVHLGDEENVLWHSTFDGKTWSPNVKIPDQKSKAPPALAVYGGLLHMVHLGDEENVIWHSTFNGYTWSPNVKIPDQKSKAAPALAAGQDTMVMVHLGDEKNYIWYSAFDGVSWTPNVRIFEQNSKGTPALARFGNLIHMVHQGDESNNLWHSWHSP